MSVRNIALNVKAKLLLTEEYPLSKQYVRKKPNQDNKKEQQYIFETDVNDIRPIQRFIKGLPNEIKKLTNHNEFGESHYY